MTRNPRAVDYIKKWITSQAIANNVHAVAHIQSSVVKLGLRAIVLFLYCIILQNKDKDLSVMTPSCGMKM